MWRSWWSCEYTSTRGVWHSLNDFLTNYRIKKMVKTQNDKNNCNNNLLIKVEYVMIHIISLVCFWSHDTSLWWPLCLYRSSDIYNGPAGDVVLGDSRQGQPTYLFRGHCSTIVVYTWLMRATSQQDFEDLSRFNSHPLWTKWPPFGRRYFHMQFREWRVLYFDYIFTEVCS